MITVIHRISLFVIMTVSALFLSCSDPAIIFPDSDTDGRVDGFISPTEIHAMVYLIDTKVIDSSIVNFMNGYYSFSSVPFGNYQLKVVADSFGHLTQNVLITTALNRLNDLRLEKFPFQIRSITPDAGNTLNASGLPHVNIYSSSYYNDSVVTIRISFKKQMDLSSVKNNFIISPALPMKITDSMDSSGHNVYFSISVIDFFKKGHISFTLKKEMSSLSFEQLDFDYTVNYYTDTTKFNDLLYIRFFNSSSLNQSQYRYFDIDSQITLNFTKLMNHSSVEKSFSITPFSQALFFWKNLSLTTEQCIIQFSSPLSIGTDYKITFDTTFSTLDSIRTPRPILFTYRTMPLRILTSSPVTFKKNVLPETPFSFTFNYPVDSASLVKAFLIKPQTDSLKFSFFDNKRAVSITHLPLQSDTTYEITFDSTLMTYSGKTSGQLFHHFFSTFTSSSNLQTNLKLIQNTFPADSLSLINCKDSIFIPFSRPMNIQSVNKHISFKPEFLFNAQWKANSYLVIRPLQPLKSNTSYTFTIASGFQTSDGDISDSDFKLTFKTKPLGLESYSPFNQQINVSRDNDVVLKFNTSIDTTALSDKIHILPPPGSLNLTVNDSGSCRITHSPFLPLTDYTLIVNDSITDQFGIRMEQRYTIKFTTAK